MLLGLLTVVCVKKKVILLPSVIV